MTLYRRRLRHYRKRASEVWLDLIVILINEDDENAL